MLNCRTRDIVPLRQKTWSLHSCYTKSWRKWTNEGKANGRCLDKIPATIAYKSTFNCTPRWIERTHFNFVTWLNIIGLITQSILEIVVVCSAKWALNCGIFHQSLYLNEWLFWLRHSIICAGWKQALFYMEYALKLSKWDSFHSMFTGAHV